MNGSIVIFRPILMWIAARLAVAGLPLIILRWTAVAATGHPATALACLIAAATMNRHALLITLLVAATEHAWGLVNGPIRLWQLTWSIKRRWPAQYTKVDYASESVQASFGGGGGGFLRSSKLLPRPILGHPALSLIPRINWELWTATWSVHANAGQTLPALERVCDAIASRFASVHKVDVDYTSPSDSIGAIRFWFRPEPDHLKGTETAPLDRTQPLPVPTGSGLTERGEVDW